MLPTHRPPTHPGEMLLEEFLEPLGVSQVEAANRMNIPFQRLNAIVKGRRGVSADTALLLEAFRKITPNGQVSTLAGKAGVSGTADGTGAEARFDSPTGLDSTSPGPAGHRLLESHDPCNHAGA